MAAVHGPILPAHPSHSAMLRVCPIPEWAIIPHPWSVFSSRSSNTRWFTCYHTLALFSSLPSSLHLPLVSFQLRHPLLASLQLFIPPFIPSSPTRIVSTSSSVARIASAFHPSRHPFIPHSYRFNFIIRRSHCFSFIIPSSPTHITSLAASNYE
ncbi:hypothetical protein BDR03DRAFT_1007561 [Suillus americanus]|nr:hypothetical protein BDR03DRAFT_1007561 [Suillus americanus]